MLGLLWVLDAWVYDRFSLGFKCLGRISRNLDIGVLGLIVLSVSIESVSIGIKVPICVR